MAMRLSQDEKSLIQIIRSIPKGERTPIFAAIGVNSAQTPFPTHPRTFKTKAEIKAGKGFPCLAATPCKRTDIRTLDRSRFHATTQTELVQFGHSPNKAVLPVV